MGYRSANSINRCKLTTFVFAIVVITARAATNFVDFETAPVHPIALGPDGRTLAVCNLPDNRVEFFDVSTGLPASTGNVPVGLDPVSVRFASTNEVWVINHISSTISVVDVPSRRIVATVETLAGPSDLRHHRHAHLGIGVRHKLPSPIHTHPYGEQHLEQRRPTNRSKQCDHYPYRLSTLQRVEPLLPRSHCAVT